MPSNLLDTNADETTPVQPALQLVPDPTSQVPVVGDQDDSRDVRVRHPVVRIEGSLPLTESLKTIRRIQKNEAQSWGLARSRAARR